MKPVRGKPRKPSSPLLKGKQQRQPKRWLLTAYIYLVMFLNGMIVLLSFLAIAYIGQQKTINPTLYSPTTYGLVLFLAIYNIFCLSNLLKMQRWAFWGYCLGGLATLILLTVLDHSTSKLISNVLFSLGNPFILFCLLFMGGKRSAWHEMSTTTTTHLS